MLVLSRKADESLQLGEDIELTILAIEGDKVKLGIKAPQHVRVLRQEVKQAIQDQQSIAVALASGPEPKSFDSLRKLVAETGD
ncbi:MAG: carbon storage regulator [Chloroflexi bacterium]|nr:MAG: carbon storage regulator [Chloroflexota bacterium]MBL1194830.1 carbon storage regulator [Chloroflexota bacterium]NOH12121.1 carbon storage regulator CsrA [Chloroflexota bacterium]